jgi:hypothetical protein
MPAQMTPAFMPGTTSFACVAWGWSDPSLNEAETALPIPRVSSATEQKIREEAQAAATNPRHGSHANKHRGFQHECARKQSAQANKLLVHVDGRSV